LHRATKEAAAGIALVSLVPTLIALVSTLISVLISTLTLTLTLILIVVVLISASELLSSAFSFGDELVHIV
jgi:hypothetical protein